MKRHLFGTAILACLMSLAGVAAAQYTSADDIQYYDALGAPASPYAGMTVTVRGAIYVLKGTYNNGTHYIMDETGGIAFYAPDAPALAYGDTVEATGPVGVFGGEIQLTGGAGVTVTPIGPGVPPTPVQYQITDLVNPYVYEDKIGNLCYVIGTVASKGTSNFYLKSGPNDSIQVYIDSDTGINLGAVANGDEYKVISPCVVYNGEVELKPRMQADLIEDPLTNPAPVIQNVNCVNWCPTGSDPIVVQALITDENAPGKAVASASLYYRHDPGDSTGTWFSVAMSGIGGGIYQGTIPAPHSTPQVDFYISATDDADPAKTSTNPGNAPAGWYEIAIGFTSIYAMQYRDPSQPLQGNNYYYQPLNVKGIVTAGTGEAGAASKFIMQEPLPADPDGNGIPTYQWSGVLVYEGTASNFVARGDMVAVGGHGEEYFGLSEMVPAKPSAIYVLSYNNDLPPASKYIPTRTLADQTLDDGNPILGEAYESVWIRTKAACVMDTLGFGEYIISDTCARADSVEVDPMVTLTYQPIIGDVVILEGFMDYDYGAFQITPISDEFVVYGVTGVDFPNQPLPLILPAGGFESIKPNPFNPKTEIRFKLNRDNLAQLNIYDIRGQLVRSLVSERLPATEHIYVWDGTDSTGRSVASGTYFARLRIGLEVMQVQKLMLVK
jgi:hypothetical protein